MKNFLKEKFQLIKNDKDKKEIDESRLYYYYKYYKTYDGKLITLIQLPHNNARGYKGISTNFPENAEQTSPYRRFFEEIVAKSL
ncbi:MAG: hypothetical protein J1E80_07215 [Desulfovibrionaceae bacterium]|nr:hypothetical protein [Desulfovibrionaceae bacterium]